MDVKESLKHYDGADRVVSSVSFAAMLKDLPPVLSHKTGIRALDEAIEGFEVGELIVVSGPTAMGKTTLCESIVTNMNRQGKRSLFFSFEVTPAKLIQTRQDPENCLFLPLQHKAMDLDWLKRRTQEAVEKFGVSAVFIDHLHYIVDMKHSGNMSLEIGATMRYLKRDIALALNIPVFIVCHAAKIPLDQEPSMHHLRDSSFVSQEADTVLIVFRRLDLDDLGKKQRTMLQGLATIKVDKARRSGTMGLKIKVKKEGHQLIESLNEPEESDERQRTTRRVACEDARYGHD